MAWQELQAELATGIVEAGYEDVRAVHWPLLRHLLLEGMRPTDLAARIGLSKQATNDVLREFESKGYITLEPDPDDRRAKRIHVTERGWGLAMTSARLSRDVGRRWAKQVGEARYAEFEAVLREIVGAQP